MHKIVSFFRSRGCGLSCAYLKAKCDDARWEHLNHNKQESRSLGTKSISHTDVNGIYTLLGSRTLDASKNNTSNSESFLGSNQFNMLALHC